MRAKTVALLAVLAAVALAAGSAAALPTGELAPEDESENGTAGICVVGADSPCNGDDAGDSNGSTDETTDDGSSHDGKMWIPEDQNRDGEIDDRFRGGETGTEIGNTDESSEEQIFIPEDQNRDGEIDDRFRGSVSEFLANLFASLFGLY